MPGQVLDQIRARDENGDYGSDRRFSQKRKLEKKVSRKDQRRELRLAKKQKRAQSHKSYDTTNTKKHNSNSKHTKSSTPVGLKKGPLAALRELKEKKRAAMNAQKLAAEEKSKTSVKTAKDDEEHDPMAKLAALKGKNLTKKTSEIRVVRESDIEDDLSDSDRIEDEGGNLLDLDSEDVLDDFGELEDEEEEDVLAKLKALKEKKNQKQGKDEVFEGFNDDLSEEILEDEMDEEFDSDIDIDIDIDEDPEDDPMEALRLLKEKKTNTKSAATVVKPSKKATKVLEPNFSASNIDDDVDFYAKKLGIKGGQRLSKDGNDDIIGGLLDDLDFIDEGDEGDDHHEDSNSYLDSDNDSEDEIIESDLESTKKENPFVAPTENATSDVDSGSESEGSLYVPPALRKKQALDAEVSEETRALQRSIKGPVNKLSEANIGTIVNDINALFLNNPRQAVTENFTSIVLESLVHQERLLDTFLYLHAAMVAGLHRVQVVDFGAFFIQNLFEKYELALKSEKDAKEAINLVSLISALYSFQIISSKLIFDMIRELLDDLNEKNAEILLKIIRTCGNQVRSEDPLALKEIVVLVSKISQAHKSSTRMEFLLESITSLKNNKLKVHNESTHELIIRLKKFLGGFAGRKDPLQVSLDDIRNIDKKGKWWLVGSAWKGSDGNVEESNYNAVALKDVLDHSEPNWLELARLQRMNTDIRRAIFISIMSADDYIDAVTKLDKLGLKKAQEREIPRILMHCAVMEPAWNPYYGILAAKLCDQHSLRKSFQFILWDLVKSFESGADDDDDDDFAGFNDNSGGDKLKKLFNLGRFFGHLFAAGSLALHVLRVVNFLTLLEDNKVLLEVTFVSMLDEVAKKSQINAIGMGLTRLKSMSETKFDDRTLIELLLKAKEEPMLLQGLKHFLKKRVRVSDFLTGRRQRQRVEWGVDSASEVISEFLREEDS